MWTSTMWMCERHGEGRKEAEVRPTRRSERERRRERESLEESCGERERQRARERARGTRSLRGSKALDRVARAESKGEWLAAGGIPEEEEEEEEEAGWRRIAEAQSERRRQRHEEGDGCAAIWFPIMGRRDAPLSSEQRPGHPLPHPPPFAWNHVGAGVVQQPTQPTGLDALLRLHLRVSTDRPTALLLLLLLLRSPLPPSSTPPPPPSLPARPLTTTTTTIVAAAAAATTTAAATTILYTITAATITTTTTTTTVAAVTPLPPSACHPLLPSPRRSPSPPLTTTASRSLASRPSAFQTILRALLPSRYRRSDAHAYTRA